MKQLFWAFIAIPLLIGGASGASAPLPWYDTALEAAMAQIRTHEAMATTGKTMGSTTPALLATQPGLDGQDPTWEDIKQASRNSWGLVPPTLSPTQTTGYASRSWPSPEKIDSPVYKGGCAENGSCYGDISSRTGQPKTTYVNGYYRKNGTYVRGHYRSSSRK